MEIGKVVGNVWATRKDEKLSGQKLLVVKLLKSKSEYKDGFLVAADNAGAGNGDLVLITKGSAARESITIIIGNPATKPPTNAPTGIVIIPANTPVARNF